MTTQIKTVSYIYLQFYSQHPGQFNPYIYRVAHEKPARL